MVNPQARRMPERGSARGATDCLQFRDERFRLEFLVESIHGLDRGPVEQPLSLSFARDLPLGGDPALLVDHGLEREADRGVRKVLEDHEEIPIEDLLELEGQLPPDDPAGRVGDLGQVQAPGGRVEVSFLQCLDVCCEEHRVRRPERRGHVMPASFPSPVASRSFPEEQPHFRQVLQCLAVEEPAPVRHPVQSQRDVLALADRAIRALRNVGNHARRDIGRAEDKLQLEREPAAAAPVGGRTG